MRVLAALLLLTHLVSGFQVPFLSSPSKFRGGYKESWRKTSSICFSTLDGPEKPTEHASDTGSATRTSASPPCVIKVIGVGGGGGNAVNRMIESKLEGVTFWAINTDAQALAKSHAPNVLNIGLKSTRGLGAGGDPEIGARAARENAKEIERICEGTDMVFITAGMGGGTGSGATPIVAEIAKSRHNCLTVGIVTKPFGFEGRRRLLQAERAIETLRAQVDTLIVISNDKLLRIVPDNTPVTDAFLVADDILRQGVFGISEIILRTGLVNVDFADVRSVMRDAGTALMGVGTGEGKTRAADAAFAAISSPLLDFPIRKAKRIVFNIVGGKDIGLQEINEASEVIYANADDNANIIFGALVDPRMGDEISMTVLACDFDVETRNDMLSMSSTSPTTASLRRPAFQGKLEIIKPFSPSGDSLTKASSPTPDHTSRARPSFGKRTFNFLRTLMSRPENE